MKTRLIILITFCVLLLLMTAVAYAANGFAINWWTVDSGGGTSQGGTYSMSGSMGQPDAGQSQGGDYILSGGFWSGSEMTIYKVMLPITMKP